MKKISVILVNYNGKQYNDKCIESIFRSTIASNLHVIIIDNASTDDSLISLQNKWGQNEQITIIPLDKNYGFSKANNKGIDWARKNEFDCFLLLNNDTEIAANTIEKMANLQEKTNAIIVPKIVYADKTDIIWCAGGKFSKIIRKPMQRGLNQKDDGKYNASGRCSFANGCCMLLNEEIIQKLGMLDERFFLYYEDTEYSMRAEEKEVSIWYCAEALVYHKVNGSTLGNERPDNAYYITRNWLMCNRMYMKKKFWFFICYFGLNRFAWIIIWLFAQKIENILAVVKGIEDYRHNVVGKYTKKL